MITYDVISNEWVVGWGTDHSISFSGKSEAEMADRLIDFMIEGQQKAAAAREALAGLATWANDYQLMYAGTLTENDLTALPILPGTYQIPDGQTPPGTVEVTGKLGTLLAALSIIQSTVSDYDLIGEAFAKFAKK